MLAGLLIACKSSIINILIRFQRELFRMKKILKCTGLALAILPSILIGKNAVACSSDPMLAGMCVFAGNFAPRGWALAQGQLLAISSNQSLFALLGTTYGGDGRTTFALPDTRGRALIGAGNGPGLSNYSLGQRGGVETVTLNITHMPSHSHTSTTSIENTVDITGAATLMGTTAVADSNVPSGKTLAKTKDNWQRIYSNVAPSVEMHPGSVTFNATGEVSSAAITTLGNTGGNQAHENRMPYIAVNWIIALQGIFPSRS